jgi:hypothetical protein
MNDAASMAAPERAIVAPDRRLNRIAGIAGLTFAAIVAVQNIALGAMSLPENDAAATKIASYFSDNDAELAVLTGMVPFAVVALFLFIGSIYPRLSLGTREAGLWARVAALGLVLVEAFFLVGIMLRVVLIANAENLAERPDLTEVLWQLHGASLVVTGLAIGLALLGLSRATYLNGLIPAWQHALGLGAVCGFFIASVAVVPAVEGSPIGLVGLAAFVVWLVWLALTSVRLLRAGNASD